MKLISAAREPLGLPELVELDDVRVRISVTMCSHAFITECHAHDEFKNTMNKIKVNEDKMTLVEESTNSDELSSFFEQSKIAVEKFAAGTNVPLLAKTCRNTESLSPLSDRKIGQTRFDMLAVPKLSELLFPTRHEIFLSSSGIFIPVSDS